MDRKLLYDTDVGPVEYLITGGVPHGLMLGPLLWNVMYDYVLRTQFPSQATLVGYVEYIGIVVTDENLEDVIWACETSVRLIKDWLVSRGLKLGEPATINSMVLRGTA